MPTASLRAPEGYHLPDAMSQSQLQHPNLFNKFGGHPCAAGFSIDQDNIVIAQELMSQAIEDQSLAIASSVNNYCQLTVPDILIPYTHRKEIIWLDHDAITTELLNEIIALDPFGQDFQLPNLAFQCSFWDSKKVRWLGQDNKHFKINNDNDIPVTFFNIESELLDFCLTQDSQQKLWVITKPLQNAWRNKISIELIVDKWFLT